MHGALIPNNPKLFLLLLPLLARRSMLDARRLSRLRTSYG